MDRNPNIHTGLLKGFKGTYSIPNLDKPKGSVIYNKYCNLHSSQIWTLRIFDYSNFYVKSISMDHKWPQNFPYHNFRAFHGWNLPISKFFTVKWQFLELLYLWKWFDVKSLWQENPWISTLCFTTKFTHSIFSQKFREINTLYQITMHCMYAILTKFFQFTKIP